MGCEWTMIAGKRVKLSAVEAARPRERIKEENVRERMAKLGLVIVSASPELTIDDLRDAVLRLWRDPETGYLMEARFYPSADPVYHSISQEEATRWESGRPTPEFIARMFRRDDPALN